MQMDTALMNMKMSPELKRILSQFTEQYLKQMQQLVKDAIRSPPQMTGIRMALKAIFLRKTDSASADQYVKEFMNLIGEMDYFATGLLLNPYLVSI